MGIFTDRGAVAIKFNIDDTSFCFINMHLEPQQKSKSISNINEIHQKVF